MSAPIGRQVWQRWTCENVIAVTPAGRLPQARQIADRCMTAVESACSRFSSDSELSRLAPGVATRVSPVLVELMRTALQAAHATGGLVDPALGRAEEAIGYRVSMDGRLAPAATGDGADTGWRIHGEADWRAITLDGDRLTVPADVTVDLGATAKAWAADRIAAECAARLGCGALVSLGGDIATAESPKRTSWNVVVQDTPADPADWIVLCGTGGVATSSVQHRTWLWHGLPVHHLLHPISGLPVRSRWTHATVIGASCVQANTWSTAALVAGEAAPDLLRRHGITARLVDRRHRVCTTGAWPGAAEGPIGDDGSCREED